MTHQLFWLETLLKAAGGIVLLAFPVSVAKLLGLPHGNVGFWARILGILLIGVAAAIYLEASALSSGLGFGGLVVINISAIVTIMALLILNQVKTKRGNVVLWLLVGLLLVLTLFELAQV